MKTIFYGFVIILIISLGLALVGGYWIKSHSSLSFSDFFNKEGKIKVDKNTKEEIKDEAKKVNDRVYQEATEHNPEGDVLPDEIDNTITDELKKEIKQKIE